MKTVTKTFYVREGYFAMLKSSWGIKTNFGTFEMKNYKDGDCQHEVRVSWQEEEKKVEITESQIDEMINRYVTSSTSDFAILLKREIFKK